MKIAVVGGGPGGLYFSILTKKAKPDCEITLFERNKADDSFGFGVVFSDETLSEFLSRDPRSYDLICDHFAYWDELDVVRDGEKVRITGNGFCGCSRKTLLQLLQQRCSEEGVKLNFNTEINDLSLRKDYDLVVAADGIGSKIREQFQNEFKTTVSLKQNKFIWMGSTRPLDAFCYFFKDTKHGAMVAHSYQYQEGMSTWIFECCPDTWKNWGFDKLNEDESQALLEEIYSDELQGHGLIQNKSIWRQFPHVVNENWHFENVVLLGDAKATAHFSIGSGTKLAMESAIGLSDALVNHSKDLQKAFQQYVASRKTRVEMIQYAANVSLDWFENMDRHIKHPFYQFAFGVMTRAKKVTYENLALRDSSFTKKVVEEFMQGVDKKTNSPGFTSFKLRELTLNNRIVMSSMGQYKAVDGVPNNWHLTHYGSRAVMGLGLILTEFTAVNAQARIGKNCTGLYSDEHEKAWKEICDFIHANSTCKIAIQLGHAGSKAGDEGNPTISKEEKLGVPQLFAASALPYLKDGRVPTSLDETEMQRIIADFVQATKRADFAGFDMIELQAHHGFLLASFLSPLTNQRNDEYGGSVENRLRFPLAVFKAMRAAFPGHKPMSVRISACDWAQGGISMEEAKHIADAFAKASADIINVSTGLTVAHQEPQMGRMWQTPFSEEIRNSLGIKTITTGSITDIDQINTILLNGRADLVALGKPLLLNPAFAAEAAAHENFTEIELPASYQRAKEGLFKQKQSEKKQLNSMRLALKPKSHKKN